ncbi:LytTR family transcriptional regulator [Peribacillus saganii]|uniref:LytTR family transcriptional regulator n=1 Tax=Peribacillus saganii TaxID=2303992 RepID=A0A372LSL8_9BACI|nr:response regulator transcription factor [Peribacillus saganii]RFU70792.1 LytTR family transcriptional regulator [Peribacillus saganii]
MLSQHERFAVQNVLKPFTPFLLSGNLTLDKKEIINSMVSEAVSKAAIIEKERLADNLEKAMTVLMETVQKQIPPKKELMIKQKNTISFVPFEEILFIERTDRKSFIHTIHKVYEANESLSSFEQAIDSRFIVSHRSYIINLEYLTKICTVGQTYKCYFKNYNIAAKISKHRLDNILRCKSV